MLRLFRENIGLKLLALLLAYLVWSLVVSRGQKLRAVEVPLDIRYDEESLVILDYEPKITSVTLQGDAAAVDRLADRAISVRVDIPDDVDPGTRRFEISRDDIDNLPRGVTVEGLDPTTVEVTAERRLEKPLVVRPNIAGEPLEGFEVVGATVDPALVRVVGAESFVGELTGLVTEPVVVRGRRASFTETVSIRREGPTWSAVAVRPSAQVRVRVEIDEARREFELAVPVLPHAEDFIAEPSEATVVLRARPSQLDRVRAQLTLVAAPDGDAVPRTPVPVVAAFGDLSPEEQSAIDVVSITPPKVRLAPNVESP